MVVFLGSEDLTQRGERTVALVGFHSSWYVVMLMPIWQT